MGLEQLQKNNELLAEVLKKNGIKKLNLTSLGNSIASGYSAHRTIKPLLYRNESLNEVMKAHDIHVETYHFARAQNNSDDKIFNWVNSNISLGQIYDINRSDYSDNGNSSMETTNLSKEKIEEYYSKGRDVRIQDVIFSNDDIEADIIIYNGLTGSFLDNVTRCGKHKLTYGIKKDQIGLEAILKLIQERNRTMNTNTQVYICGAPNFLGLKITEIINSRLKKSAKKYANTIYVEPAKSKFIYESLDGSGKKPDIHYDEIEYLKLLNNIFSKIAENYEFLKAKINIDRSLATISSEIELLYPEYKGHNVFIQKIIDKIFELDCACIMNSPKKVEYIDEIKKYLLEVFPYDYFYLGKDNIVEVLEHQKTK